MKVLIPEKEQVKDKQDDSEQKKPMKMPKGKLTPIFEDKKKEDDPFSDIVGPRDPVNYFLLF